MGEWRNAAALAAGCALLAGCATVRGGPPLVAQAEDARFLNIKAAMQGACFDLPSWKATAVDTRPAATGSAALAGAPGNAGAFESVRPGRLQRAPDPLERNELVTAYLLAADDVYAKFEAGMLNDGRVVGFVGSVASMGLGVATAATGGHTAKVLGAANAAVDGERAAFSKEFLYEQTVPAMQNQMRARRAEVSARIYQSMKLSVQDWPTCLALKDLREYEHAGTLVSALQQLSETAAREKEAQEASVERVRFERGALAEALQLYLEYDGATDAEFAARLDMVLKQALPQSGLAVPAQVAPEDYLNDLYIRPGLDAQRRMLIAAIIAVEQDAAARAKLADALAK